MHYISLDNLIIVLFFIAINFVSFKIFVKEKNLIKFLFIIFLTITEIFASVYVKTFLIYQNTTILFGILGIMAISDIENMEVPEWTLVTFAFYSILNFILLCIESKFLYKNIFVAAVTLILLLLLGKLYNNMLGGADIIMITSISLVFGLMHMLYMLIVGCIISLLFMIVYSKIKNSKITGVPLPFLPGLTIGFLFAFLFV